MFLRVFVISVELCRSLVWRGVYGDLLKGWMAFCLGWLRVAAVAAQITCMCFRSTLEID
jgi:hypothetical protein